MSGIVWFSFKEKEKHYALHSELRNSDSRFKAHYQTVIGFAREDVPLEKLGSCHSEWDDYECQLKKQGMQLSSSVKTDINTLKSIESSYTPCAVRSVIYQQGPSPI